MERREFLLFAAIGLVNIGCGHMLPRTERKRKLSYNFKSSYSPTITSSRNISTAQPRMKKEPLFTVMDASGRPASGVYVPLSFYTGFDGWEVKILEGGSVYNITDILKDNDERGRLTMHVHAALKGSNEFKGLFPLIVPTDMQPSRKTAEFINNAGHKVFIDHSGRFYSSMRLNALELVPSLGRMDLYQDAEYLAVPDDIELNFSQKSYRGKARLQTPFIYTPMYNRSDTGRPFTMQGGREVISVAIRDGIDAVVDGCYELINHTDHGDCVSKTKDHYIYPAQDMKTYANKIYADERKRFHENGGQGMTLIELADMLRIADCDIANTEYMIRSRMHGNKTRLAIGYKTHSDGNSGSLHGWCETVKDGHWEVTDATPWKHKIRFENAIELAQTPYAPYTIKGKRKIL